MQRIMSSSPKAGEAINVITKLQSFFTNEMHGLSDRDGITTSFHPVEWFRDEGRHGGGVRYVAEEGGIFDRASINMSQVQYEGKTKKPLSSASALSAIVHPKNPLAPSIHMHISYTELKSGKGYFRLMADLNPSIEFPEDKEAFNKSLQKSAPHEFAVATKEGEAYFFIPALKRHRGVCHFYLENFSSEDFQKDLNLAENFGLDTIKTYKSIVERRLKGEREPTKEEKDKQLAYHTLYFFQVLTLDRGTTTGLLVHDQNDEGIMGSLPSRVDKKLLSSWQKLLPDAQKGLLSAICHCLEGESVCLVERNTKLALAKALREHYQNHPDALNWQAKGSQLPKTVENHT